MDTKFITATQSKFRMSRQNIHKMILYEDNPFLRVPDLESVIVKNLFYHKMLEHIIHNTPSAYIRLGTKDYEALRQDVLKRDDYSCQECGITESLNMMLQGSELPVHHIDYNRKHNTRNNLITVCPRHHSMAHHIKYAVDLRKKFEEITTAKEQAEYFRQTAI